MPEDRRPHNLNHPASRDPDRRLLPRLQSRKPDGHGGARSYPPVWIGGTLVLCP